MDPFGRRRRRRWSTPSLARTAIAAPQLPSARWRQRSRPGPREVLASELFWRRRFASKIFEQATMPPETGDATGVADAPDAAGRSSRS